jgi:hypothetical protein
MPSLRVTTSCYVLDGTGPEVNVLLLQKRFPIGDE